MKNREYYKDEIYAVACRHDRFAINKTTKKIGGCLEIPCNDCLFNPGGCDCYERARVWLEQEYTEPILDSVEKRYLEGFIQPFRSRVKSITKWPYSNNHAYLQILMRSVCGQEYERIDLPLFVRNKMYQNMIIGKKYTLKELGLFEK